MKENIPTTTIKLPISGKEVVVYNYLTYGESRKLQEKILGQTKVDVQTQQLEPMSGALLLSATDFTMSCLVKDYNQEEIENLPQEDGDFLAAKINEITNQSRLSLEAKKK